MGRPRGSLNKATASVRQVIEAALGKSAPERILELCRGKNNEAEMLMGLMPYMYTKLASRDEAADELHELGADPQLVAKVVELLKLKIRGNSDESNG